MFFDGGNVCDVMMIELTDVLMFYELHNKRIKAIILYILDFIICFNLIEYK
jgi:hypothetical protein